MKDLKKRGKQGLVTIALSLSILVTGCANKEKPKDLTFEDYSNQMFQEIVSSSAITYSQFIEDPENFGITEYDHVLATLSKKEYDKSIKQCEEDLAQLLKFDYDTLTTAQKIDYDITKGMLERSIASKDSYYYSEPLSPLDGDHITLSGIVSLYGNRYFQTLVEKEKGNKKEVEKFFEIYEMIGKYFNEVAQYEKEKAKAGLFMNSSRAEVVRKACLSVVNNNASDYKKTFQEEVTKLSFLSDSEKKELIEQSDSLVEKHIVPAYQKLVDTMNDLKDQGGKSKGFYETEAGKIYYENLLKSTCSVNATPEELMKLLEENLAVFVNEKDQILADHPNIENEIVISARQWPDAESITKMLSNKAKEDFPDADLAWGVKEMPTCMNSFAGGLFYPFAIDSTLKEEYIYLGTMNAPGTLSFLQVLAHEGVPGHLFHYNYLNDIGTTDYRKVLAWAGTGLVGYLEGWTTYVEEIGYSYGGLSDVQAREAQLNRLIEITLVTMVDIGVNYYGWENDKISEVISQYAPQYLIMSTYIKSIVEESPGLYSSYAVGYLYTKHIIDAINEKSGGTMSKKEVHEKYLSVGPVTYDILMRELGVAQ
ncbi:DUF885 domain-containing protein [Lachnoclostridium phytofermentans]|uniref:DUF885 domain-containing protein n=1 Tax=Lachnoclostridium phytofermentans (strain ATCC 700394 / DSM 18823 / ISDg) TaxID=357809 RepID=A9KRY2_LACP7|nr:DUF885 domain-containing protein [Lachnoclostridium phytofermentans]ABX40613.1 protein of unknown function DUF885 [Lachnoclostridium phytofermentans ISDg]